LRFDGFGELALWNRRCTSNHCLHRESDNHKLRCKQHTELDGNGSDECCRYAGNIHLYIGKRFDKREPIRDHNLHTDGDQWLRFDNVHGNSHRNRVR